MPATLPAAPTQAPEHYSDASPAVIEASRSNQEQFDEYTDSFGSFRSIFLPLHNADGQQYIVGWMSPWMH